MIFKMEYSLVGIVYEYQSCNLNSVLFIRKNLDTEIYLNFRILRNIKIRY